MVIGGSKHEPPPHDEVPSLVTEMCADIERADPCEPVAAAAFAPTGNGDHAREGARHIDALRDGSKKPGGKLFPVRARIRLASETALRSKTIDNLDVPEHYTRGSDTLETSDEIDRAGDHLWATPRDVRSAQAA